MSAPGDAPAPAQAGLLHPANLLTITRLLLSPVLFLLILQAEDSRGASWAAFGLGLAMASTDFFDGRVARRANVVSPQRRVPRSARRQGRGARRSVLPGGGGALLVGAGDDHRVPGAGNHGLEGPLGR